MAVSALAADRGPEISRPPFTPLRPVMPPTLDIVIVSARFRPIFRGVRPSLAEKRADPVLPHAGAELGLQHVDADPMAQYQLTALPAADSHDGGAGALGWDRASLIPSTGASTG